MHSVERLPLRKQEIAMAESTAKTTPCGLVIPTPLEALEEFLRQVESGGLLVADDAADQAVIIARLSVAAAKDEPVKVPKSYS